MKLGNIFKAITKIPALPAAIAADVMTMGASKAIDKKFLVEKVIESIADDLNDQ